MSYPTFTVFVGIKDEFSETDLTKLTPDLRKAYSECPDWDPGEDIIVEGLSFESFDRGRDGTSDPGEYVGFGVQIFGHWYNNGASTFSIEELGWIEETKQRMEALFERLNLDAEVGVFCFTGYGP